MQLFLNCRRFASDVAILLLKNLSQILSGFSKVDNLDTASNVILSAHLGPMAAWTSMDIHTLEGYEYNDIAEEIDEIRRGVWDYFAQDPKFLDLSKYFHFLPLYISKVHFCILLHYVLHQYSRPKNKGSH